MRTPNWLELVAYEQEVERRWRNIVAGMARLGKSLNDGALAAAQATEALCRLGARLAAYRVEPGRPKR